MYTRPGPRHTNKRTIRAVYNDDDAYLHKLTLQELQRYDDLRIILGVGNPDPKFNLTPLQRRVARVQKAESLFDTYTPPVGQFVTRTVGHFELVGVDSGHGYETVSLQPVGHFDPYTLLRDIKDLGGPSKETDIGDYRKHAREMHGIRRELFGYVPGLEYPPDAGRYPPSPFGPPETRFRKMTGNPWPERNGFIQTYRYC